MSKFYVSGNKRLTPSTILLTLEKINQQNRFYSNLANMHHLVLKNMVDQLPLAVFQS